MIFLVEIEAHDGVSPSTLYLSTDGYTSRPSDTPPNQYYEPRLLSAGSVERHMFSGGDGLSGGTTGGGSQVGFGAIVVVNGTPYDSAGTVDTWRSLALRTVTVKSLDSRDKALSQAVTRFVGRADQIVSTRALEQLEISIHDRLVDLDKPILTNVYAGTTTATGLGYEGEADLKDRIKQKIWGKKNNAPTVPVNVYDLLYQVNDGSVASIAIYDGGLALDNVGDFGSLASLMAAGISPGQFGTALALGVVRLGGTPAGAVTADVIEGATAADRTAGQIAARMLAWHQSMYPNIAVSFQPGTIAALDALNGAECGILVQDTETALSAIGRMLNSVGAWLLPVVDSTSEFQVGRLDAPSGPSLATFDIDDCIGGSPDLVGAGDDGRGIPVYKVTVKYDQLGVVQTGDQLFGAVTTGRRAYLAEEWRQEITENASILTQHPNAPALVIETALATAAAAQAEAARLLSLHSVRNEIIRMTLPSDDAEGCEIGTVQELTSRKGRLGLGAAPGSGREYVVIGRGDDYDDAPIVTLDLWGRTIG